MFEEIRAYVLMCQVPKDERSLLKSNAQLHPIAVQQKGLVPGI